MTKASANSELIVVPLNLAKDKIDSLLLGNGNFPISDLYIFNAKFFF